MSNRQHKNGVSPRNQTLHEKSGETLCWVVGVVLAACFIKYVAWLLIGVLFFIFMTVVLGDLWRGM